MTVPTSVQFKTLVEVAYNTPTGSYAVAFTPDGSVRSIRVSNKTNGDFYISFDGVSNHEYVAAGESLSFAFDDFGHIAGKVYIKTSSVAASSGTIRFSAFAVA